MAIVFNVLLHALLLGSLCLFAVAIVRVAMLGTDQVERILRIAALFAGAMVTLGTQASGANYATFTVDALAGARPASAVAHAAATVIPALMGAGLGFYVVRTLKRSETMALRVLSFIGMLATTAFLQVYATAAIAKGVDLGAAALPNVTFTAGVILTVVFTYDRNKTSPQAPGVGQLLTGMVRKHQKQQVAVAPVTRRDPFDGI